MLLPVSCEKASGEGSLGRRPSPPSHLSLCPFMPIHVGSQLLTSPCPPAHPSIPLSAPPPLPELPGQVPLRLLAESRAATRSGYPRGWEARE